jgi:hypothetical protein
MGTTSRWTQADSLNTMKGNQQPSSCQGAGHALGATACLSVRLLRRPLRRPRPTLGAIEQLFHDVKEVWGAGQQQVRNVYARIGAFTVNLVLYSVVEVWAWPHGEEALVDCSRSPWDSEERRPSQADKRKALQRLILREEIRAAVQGRVEPEGFPDLAIRLLDLAA